MNLLPPENRMTPQERARRRVRVVLHATPGIVSQTDLSKTEPMSLSGDETDDLRLVAVDPCRRCGHDNERHLRQGFHSGERDQRCVPGCECRAFREPWGEVLRGQALGILLGLIVSLLIIALAIGVLS